MRSALLEVNGVARVQVTLENGETMVTYDPRRATVEDLLAAVNHAQGPFPYSAVVKQPPRPGTSAR